MHLHFSGEVKKQLGGETACFLVTSGMPWDGEVKIAYTGQKTAAMKFAVRIPGWCENWSVKGTEKFQCKEEKGYYYIEGTWEQGCEIVFTFAMEARLYQADDRVREDFGKLAVMRGPIVYCAEEADNGKCLHLYQVDAASQPKQAGEVTIAGGKYPVIDVSARRKVPSGKADGLYTTYKKPEYAPAQLHMIPYFAWANRGENEMAVWFYGC